MLAAVMRGADDLAVEDVPTPEPGPGEVLVAVGANTICGTDVRILAGEKTTGVELPVILGHETAGHVAAVGDGVEGYETGAPVAMAPVIPCLRCWACRHDLENICERGRIMGYAPDGGLAQYMLVPADAVAAGCLFVAGEDLPSEQLALAEPLGAVVAGQRWSRVEPDDVVLVMGAGPIGLLHLQLARHSGAREVIVSEPSAGRRAAAERFGAGVTVDPQSGDLAAAVEEATDGVGVDAAIVCIGVPALVGEALGLSRPGGRVNAFAGFPKDGPGAEIDPNVVHYKQVVLTGSANSRRRDYATALRLIEDGRIDTAAMVTHRFGLPDAREALGKVGADDAIKIAVMP
jgi:L-iditol 2-dehydrogenase